MSRPIDTLIGMEPSTTSSYLTAELRASEAELDLTAKQPFSLQIIVTLHAPKPALVYAIDTFLLPRNAMIRGGIDFIRQGWDGVPESRNTVIVCRDGGPSRPWYAQDFLLLQPGIPHQIDIPFNSTRPVTTSGEAHFDLRLWLSFSSFQTGQTYKAELSPTTKASWWRWATPHEVQQDMPNQQSGLAGLRAALSRWWKGGDDHETGVPVLPEAEQLPIRISGPGISFTCIGKLVDYQP
jgi:hypothetical protein